MATNIDIHAALLTFIRYGNQYLIKEKGCKDENVKVDAVEELVKALQAEADSVAAGHDFNFTIDGGD